MDRYASEITCRGCGSRWHIKMPNDTEYRLRDADLNRCPICRAPEDVLPDPE